MAGSKTVKGGAYKGGPLAHLARLADFKFNKDFDPITVGPEMEPMPEEVVSDLSTDQQYGYRLYRMIRTGICHMSRKGDSCSNCQNSSEIHQIFKRFCYFVKFSMIYTRASNKPSRRLCEMKFYNVRAFSWVKAPTSAFTFMKLLA